MSHYDVEGVLQRMREACNAQNESQLARFLGIQSSTIVAWRTAKKPPYWACFELYEKTGYTVEWMVTGEAPRKFPKADENKTFNLPIDEFIESFEGIITTGIHMGTLNLEGGATTEDIERLSRLYFNSMNQSSELFPKKKKELPNKNPEKNELKLEVDNGNNSPH